MAKLKSDAINEKDIKEYLETCSDFDFELSVLKMLNDNAIECEHGGSYDDPVTGKSRQFDIRSIIPTEHSETQCTIRLAVECKNIRENFPVLVSCVPRKEHESYHEIALVSDNKPDVSEIRHPFRSRAKILCIPSEFSIYKPNDFVGKNIAQIGRTIEKSNDLTYNDGEIYEKWAQCLSSAHDLVERTYWSESSELHQVVILPIVVIPNNRLWMVEYNAEGTRSSEPKQTDRCSCFVGKSYEMGDKMGGTTMLISHIEIMTLKGFDIFVKSQLISEEGVAELFPLEGIVEAHSRL